MLAVKDEILKNLDGAEVPSLEDIKDMFLSRGIETIRLEFVDVLGVNRGKILPVEMLDEMFEDGIAFCAAIMAIGFDNEVAEVEGLSSYNYDDFKVVPDPSRVFTLPYQEKTALILGDIYYHEERMRQSPRWFLKNMIEEYNKLGLDPIAAAELEFFLFNKEEDGSYTPYTNETGNCYTSNIRIDPKNYFKDLTSSLKQMDFNVLYMNHEFYAGQYEYNWKHARALRAADEGAMFKGICKDLAEQRDMLATFMGRPKNDNGGSGCHFHFSLNDLETGKNAFDDPDGTQGMSKVMRHFVAGVLKHASALVAFLAPTINCYKRFMPDSFAPYYIGWGYDNRTTFVRIPGERGKATRAEIRAGSAAANPYLAMGSILAAGLDGIKNELEPPEIVTTDLYNDESLERRVVPKSLFRALKELEADEWMCKMAGKDLINNFIAVKEHEVETFTNHVTDWEWDNYVYHI